MKVVFSIDCIEVLNQQLQSPLRIPNRFLDCAKVLTAHRKFQFETCASLDRLSCKAFTGVESLKSSEKRHISVRRMRAFRVWIQGQVMPRGAPLNKLLEIASDSILSLGLVVRSCR